VQKVKFPWLSALVPVLLVFVAIFATANGYELLLFHIIPVNGILVAVVAAIWLIVVIVQYIRARQAAANAPAPAPMPPFGPNPGAPAAPLQ